ncbi:ATP-dependent DNA ligase [Paenibacillus gansuensis]|uniref:DNA ligase n=1 Tax=Paenibacillus gansuensis TaxID=306542 RepID=A0ABW5PBK3_9BACL
MKWIAPMKAEKGLSLLNDPGWIYEPKWDGFRVQIHKTGLNVKAYSLTGEEIGEKLTELEKWAQSISIRNAVLDGEAVCLRGNRPDYDDAAYRLRISRSDSIRQASRTHPLTLVVFDLLYDGRDMMQETLALRKERLAETAGTGANLVLSPVSEGSGTGLLQFTKEQKWEGIIGKKKSSLYVPGMRSPDWRRLHHERMVDGIILGYRTAPGFALMLGLHFRTVRYKPVAWVEQGIDGPEAEKLLGMLKRLETVREEGMNRVEPILCCRFSYTERGWMHKLSGTKYVCFLPGKRPEDCLWST